MTKRTLSLCHKEQLIACKTSLLHQVRYGKLSMSTDLPSDDLMGLAADFMVGGVDGAAARGAGLCEKARETRVQ